ncbi:hypothetical protein AB0L05_25965 [Nonomuraea pusilla]|uniref:hypothetical protein n=1 Tax=Nonomuraea pusilla TaxID=46177 RepID=UPI00332B10A8
MPVLSCSPAVLVVPVPMLAWWWFGAGGVWFAASLTVVRDGGAAVAGWPPLGALFHGGLLWRAV